MRKRNRMHTLSPTFSVSLGTRLKSARTDAGLSQSELAKASEVALRTIQNYEADKSSPTVDFVVQVAERLGVAPAWIVDGVHLDASDTGASPQRAETGALARRLPQEYADTFTLTVYTHVEASAGGGLYGYEPSAEDAIEVDRSKQLFAELLGFWPPDDMRGVRVRGASMNRAFGGIVDGQIVLYRPVLGPDDVADGARHVLTVSEGEDSRVLVKRVQLIMGGGVRLSADNGAANIVDEILVPDGDGGLKNRFTGETVHVNFLGRVVWPTETVDLATAEVVASTLETLVARGYLSPPEPPRLSPPS